ncbi:MAG: TonB-dependent receptor [Parasphingorhabdus sp.]
MKLTKVALSSSMIFGLALAGLAGTPAFAQDTDSADESQSGGNVIVVTAQRREQSIQDVPIAISAFSPKQLDTLAVKKTLDLVDTIPNFVGSNNTTLGSANVYFLRGQGQDESFPTFDPAVGTYVDEIFYSRQNGNNIALFDIERTEVLRGPQGTLFGKNTTGGAINIVLRKPGEELGGFVEASYGRFDEVMIRGSLDLPLSDSARFMVSGFGIDDNGWLRNTRLGINQNDRNAWGARFAADIDVSDTINWYAAVDYIDDSGTNITGRDTNLDTNAATGIARTSGNYGEVDLVTTSLLPLGLGAVFPGAVSKAQPGSVTQSFNISSNLAVQTGDNGQINLILGYRKVENDFLTNFPLPQFDAFMTFPSLASPSPDDVFIIDNIGEFKQYSVELKYNASLFDDFLNVTTGLFYLKEDNRSDFAAYFAGPVPSRDRIITNETENIAGYIQGDFALTDNITATAGVRYTDEKKTFQISDNRPIGDITDLTTANMIALGIPIEQREKVWTPRFALQFQATDDWMFYASATRGFRSGGWNARVNTASGLLPFSSEKVWSYEAGTRLTVGNVFSVAATAFYIEAKDLQVNTAISQGVFAVGNAGRLLNSGLEIEAFINPTPEFNIYASLGVMNARYRPDAAEVNACAAPNFSFSVFDINCDIVGPKRSPDVQATLGGSYDIEIGNATITPRGSVRLTSDQEVATRGLGPSDGYVLVNAGVDIKPIGEALTFSVECQNCFDKRYLVATFGNQDTYFNNPGRWTIRANYKFGGRAN